MTAPRQESLLPDTDALPKATVEIGPYRGKILVRYRRPDGTTWQRQFKDRNEADLFFVQCLEDLKHEVHK